MTENEKDLLTLEAFNTLDIKKLNHLYDEMSKGNIKIPIAYTMFFMEFDMQKESYEKNFKNINQSILEFNTASLILDKTGQIESLEKIQGLFLKSLDNDFLHTVKSVLDKQEILQETSFYSQIFEEINSRQTKSIKLIIK